jgi:hypothetical protein
MAKKLSVAQRVARAQASMRAAAERYALGASKMPVMYGPTRDDIDPELLARRQADDRILAEMRRLRAAAKRRPAKKRATKKRATKKRATPAQLRARKASASRAKAGMAGRMRAGTRYNPRSASKSEKTLYAKALRDARKVAPKKRRTVKKKTSRKGASATVTAAQVIKMAQKGALKKWLCSGVKRTGCGSSGRVVAGKGRFSRVR